MINILEEGQQLVSGFDPPNHMIQSHQGCKQSQSFPVRNYGPVSSSGKYEPDQCADREMREVRLWPAFLGISFGSNA
jgi:hypothetical protein